MNEKNQVTIVQVKLGDPVSPGLTSTWVSHNISRAISNKSGLPVNFAPCPQGGGDKCIIPTNSKKKD